MKVASTVLGGQGFPRERLPYPMDDQAAFDVHAQLKATRPPHPALAALRADDIRPREDSVSHRTR